MRQFAETGTQDKSEFMDELQSTKAKLLSLKEHVIDVTSRMIGALEEAPDTAAINDADDDDTPFTLVANSKRGRQLLRQQNARARQTVPQSPLAGQVYQLLLKVNPSQWCVGWPAQLKHNLSTLHPSSSSIRGAIECSC